VNRSTVKAAAKKPTQSLDQQYKAAQTKAEELKTQLDSARAEFFTETSKPLAARARQRELKAKCIDLWQRYEDARRHSFDLSNAIFAREHEPRAARAVPARERIEAAVASNAAAIAKMTERLRELAMPAKLSGTEEAKISSIVKEWAVRDARSKVFAVMSAAALAPWRIGGVCFLW